MIIPSERASSAATPEPKNIFVLGMDELNLDSLRRLPGLEGCRFHSLLDFDELVGRNPAGFTELLSRAQRQLERFDGEIDAITGYWDFPVSSLVPILCERFDLPSPPLEAVVKCEHKYWSRLEQQKVTSAHPGFGLVDLENNPTLPVGLGFPAWLKPVKSFSSDLAYKVTGSAEFDDAVTNIRQGIGKVGEPFEELLDHLDLPPEIAEAGGQACLAEEAVTGRQVTVEGYSAHGEVRAYGVVDSINYEGTSSFLRYQYPSNVPEAVRLRLEDISVRLIEQIGLTPSTFNIEYFWDPDTDAINIIEVNPRLSQSHARLFDAVDGAPNLQCMVHLALGEHPRLPRGRGEHRVAAKWFLRRFTDGVVRRVPGEEEIAEIERDLPGVTVQVIPGQGERLSDLPGQDSYSYELADIFIGADDEAELNERYQRCVDALHFEFDE
ncbi:ATP-grasp domain-containing protein [Saccharopolyspora kobensis]|uniref:ATP-grasp domain-containing protein n=1 Tax=Saccharopolyspora kobensis TaxID=146035 RepID=A0A1H5VLI2_9PSEU|nr:ATP-grasp domain-containing protein [Saccharopolyspora kobensis]SEF87718.1 ATP-grasp domain-containing protein [Saccharopolyspora kobensis]SFC59910.1 ATP-grasp domain-containing protein [Saccharopolyspora kobensis]